MDVIRWPSGAPTIEKRIEHAWDRKFHGEVLEWFLHSLKTNSPGPDVDEHPDNDAGDDLYGGDCYCCDCLFDY